MNSPCLILPRMGIILMVLITQACTSKDTPQPPCQDLKEIPLVFIHGFKGSTLENSKGEAQWLTAPQALGFSTPRLDLPIIWHEKSQAQDTLRAKEVLSHVQIPLLYKEEVYGPWLSSMKKLERPHYSFVYDWRRDNNESLAFFEKWIRKIQAQHQGKAVQVN